MIDLSESQNLQLNERPETSKFSRLSRRHNRTKTQMRSTSNGWDNQRTDRSPLIKRRLTLDKHKQAHTPKPSVRPTTQERPFRAGITLQQYFNQQGDFGIQKSQEPEGDQDGLFVKEFNFQIQQRDDDDEQQSLNKSRQNPRSSKHNLQVVQNQIEDKNFSIRNVSNVWKMKQPPKLPQYPPVNIPDRKRRTTMDFYKHKAKNDNIQEFEAREEYLLKKYANKFQLNNIGQERRIDRAINRNQKSVFGSTRTKF